MLPAVARLRRRSDGRTHEVRANTRIGRAPDAALRIETHFVSTEHASIRWNGEEWELRDLGSTNGTIVDGVRVSPGEPVRIDVGSLIELGDESERWEVVAADPPGLRAERLDGRGEVAADGGVLALPDAARSLAVVYADGKGGYALETADGERRAAEDGELIELEGARWRLSLPGALVGTPTIDAHKTLATVQLRFFVSSDEEKVELEIVHRGRAQRLPAQWPFYTLLTLARLRLAAKDAPEAERGWVDRDKLLKMLKLDTNALNVSIHTARAALSAAGLIDGAEIVEVRRGQRRFGTDRVEVARL